MKENTMSTSEGGGYRLKVSHQGDRRRLRGWRIPLRGRWVGWGMEIPTGVGLSSAKTLCRWAHVCP